MKLDERLPEYRTPPTPITPRLWQAAEALFHAALELPADERRGFLEGACEGDEILLEEVASLLTALDAPEAFSERAATELAAELTAKPASDETEAAPFPERLGPYRLIDVLGEGGMSTVYLAEQCEPLPRRVALKLMRWGGMRGEALRRFELEREALARMNHPNIAQVFGAGATEHGQPYVVIEHVPGPPITKYCDDRRLSIEQRLRLFVAVCHGVRHAHEKAVIHRDLKPSNILVAEVQGEALPKIIDFGIAKSLDPWSDSAAQATRSQLRVGSPGYMSPEAILEGGRGVDTRSDVYSLGVVLCQLLIGVRPFETPALFAALGRGQKNDPPRPSRRLAAHARRPEHPARTHGSAGPARVGGAPLPGLLRVRIVRGPGPGRTPPRRRPAPGRPGARLPRRFRCGAGGLRARPHHRSTAPPATSQGSPAPNGLGAGSRTRWMA
jgi:serine/threonine protein kinase